jgi:hypothetical protein
MAATRKHTHIPTQLPVGQLGTQGSYNTWARGSILGQTTTHNVRIPAKGLLCHSRAPAVADAMAEVPLRAHKTHLHTHTILSCYTPLPALACCLLLLLVSLLQAAAAVAVSSKGSLQ